VRRKMTEPTLTEQVHGKTIVRVQEKAPDSDTGYEMENLIVLHFEDGTGLELRGSGDDCDEWIEAELLDEGQIKQRRTRQFARSCLADRDIRTYCGIDCSIAREQCARRRSRTAKPTAAP
jgi:hypothetical protein